LSLAVEARTTAPGGMLAPSRPQFDVPDLPRWSAAVRGMLAGVRDARLLVVSDSVAQGFGAVAGGWTPDGRGAAWPKRLADLMKAGGLPASAASLAGAGAGDLATGGYGAYDPRVSLGSGWSVTTLASLGGRLFTTPDWGDEAWSFQPDGPVDRFDLYAVCNTALGVIAVETDGVVRATIDTLKTPGLELHTIRFPETSGPISVRRASGGAVFIAGGVAWKSELRRVQVINAGWGGSRVADWTTTDQAYRAYGALPVAGADLTVICLTINDWNNGTTVAAYRANLGLLVDRALVSGDVLMMTGTPSDPAQGKASYATQQAIAAAAVAVATEKGLAAPIDGAALFGGTFAPGLMFDAVHPNAAGQARIAQSVRARIMI
jgi:lysophospholipase L1-like esterase